MQNDGANVMHLIQFYVVLHSVSIAPDFHCFGSTATPIKDAFTSFLISFFYSTILSIFCQSAHIINKIVAPSTLLFDKSGMYTLATSSSLISCVKTLISASV